MPGGTATASKRSSLTAGFYLCCQVNSTGRHVFSHDGLCDDGQPESRDRSQGVRFDHHSDRGLWTPRLPSGHREAGITGGSFWQYAGLTSTGLRFGVRSRNAPCGRRGGWDSVSCAPSHLILRSARRSRTFPDGMDHRLGRFASAIDYLVLASFHRIRPEYRE